MNPAIRTSDTEFVLPGSLINKYSGASPRYTSYPTANHFHEEFGVDDYIRCARQSNLSADVGLSLYFHIPFCEHLCFYCGCSKVLTKNRSRAVDYMQALCREIELTGELFDRQRTVDQLHLGGGTPTFLSPEQITQLIDQTSKHFSLCSDADRDFSIEIDPRTVSRDAVFSLKQAGFNRMSIGVQDFSPEVQQAIHRIQPLEMVSDTLSAARDSGFDSVNFDLIYGLPLQSSGSFNETVDKVVALAPDRISLFNYAHLPSMFPAQRRILDKDLPDPGEKLEIFSRAAEKLTGAGYVYLGMDHFAKPDDTLALAHQQGKMHRSFQGYTTHGHCDLIAMGVTSISKVGNCYSQNTKTLEEYYARIDDNKLPVCRGIELTRDDEIRRYVIEQLMCNSRLSFQGVSKQYEIDFRKYFSREVVNLSEFAEDGLVEISDNELVVNSHGKHLIRLICATFDSFLPQNLNAAHARTM